MALVGSWILMNTTWRIVNWALLAFLVLLLFFEVYSLYDLFANSEHYRFGTEIGGWRYRSETSFIVASVLELSIVVIGILAPVFLTKRGINPLLRLISLSLVVIMIAVL
jgi:hypothetical protein